MCSAKSLTIWYPLALKSKTKPPLLKKKINKLNSFVESSVHWKPNDKNSFLLFSTLGPQSQGLKSLWIDKRAFYEWHSWWRGMPFVSLPWHSFCSLGKLIFNKRCSLVPLIISSEGFADELLSVQPAFDILFSWMVKFKLCVAVFALQSFSSS